MSRMRLLFITKDWRFGIERNTVYLSRQLAKLVDYMEWNDAGDIRAIIKKLPHAPDFILLNDLRPTRCPEITGLDTLKTPFGAIMHDLQYQPVKRKRFIQDNNIRHLFVHYRDYFYKEYPAFRDRMIWFPHWADTGVFRDYGLPKAYTFLMMGVLADKYPLREKMYETMANMPGFMYHPHPGYGKKAYGETDYVVGKRYAKELNRAKLFLTDNSVYRFALMKYFEAPACNALLLAPHTQELADLGFIPSVNYIEVDAESFLDKAKYYAQHYERAGRDIASKGMAMVRTRHSAEKRAAQLVKKVERIIG